MNCTSRPLYSVSIDKEAEWAPQPVCAFRKRKNLLPLRASEPRTVHPVASHYIDCATAAPRIACIASSNVLLMWHSQNIRSSLSSHRPILSAVLKTNTQISTRCSQCPLTPVLSSSSSIWHLQPSRVSASSVLRLQDDTQGYTTVGRTPLYEWSVRHRDLYLTNTQHSQQTNIHALGGIQTRNPSRRSSADPCLRPLGHWDRHTCPLHKRMNLEPPLGM